VLAQDPPAHAQDIEQPSVNLLVAAPDNEPPDGYVMPDLTGVPVVTAQMELSKVGIKTATPNYAEGSIQTAVSVDIQPGSVVAQSPLAGARVDQTTLVKLTVQK
jgi:beta-lactam-binding protein with PASTA domain